MKFRWMILTVSLLVYSLLAFSGAVAAQGLAGVEIEVDGTGVENAEPGEAVTFIFFLSNTGLYDSDNFCIDVTTMNDAWSAEITSAGSYKVTKDPFCDKTDPTVSIPDRYRVDTVKNIADGLSNRAILTVVVQVPDLSIPTMEADGTNAGRDPTAFRLDAFSQTKPEVLDSASGWINITEVFGVDLIQMEPESVIVRSVGPQMDSSERIATFNVTVQNLANSLNAIDGRDTFTLSVLSKPAGWEVYFELNNPAALVQTITIDGGNQSVVKFFVEAPILASFSDDGYAVTVQATSARGVNSSSQYQDSDIDAIVNVEQRYSVDIISWDGNSTGAPGEKVYYNFTVLNTGNGRDEFQIDVSSTFGWDAITADERFLLPKEDVKTVMVVTTIPEDNTPLGFIDKLTFKVSSLGALEQKTTIFDTEYVWTEVVQGYDVELTAEPAIITGKPGEIVTFNIQVKNTGNGEDSFILTDFPTWSGILGWEIEKDRETVTDLPAGGLSTVRIQVRPDIDARFGEKLWINFTATSEKDPMAEAEDTIALLASVEKIADVEVIPPVDDDTTDLDNMVTPGEWHDIEFIVRNTGNFPDKFRFLRSSEHENWETVVTPAQTPNAILPNETVTVRLRIRIPSYTPRYDVFGEITSGNVTLTAQSVDTENKTNTGAFQVLVDSVRSISIAPMSNPDQKITPSSKIIFDLLVTNDGNIMDSILIHHPTEVPAEWGALYGEIGDSWEWELLEMEPQETRRVQLHIISPETADRNRPVMTQVRASSVFDPTVSNTTTLTVEISLISVEQDFKLFYPGVDEVFSMVVYNFDSSQYSDVDVEFLDTPPGFFDDWVVTVEGDVISNTSDATITIRDIQPSSKKTVPIVIRERPGSDTISRLVKDERQNFINFTIQATKIGAIDTDFQELQMGLRYVDLTWSNHPGSSQKIRVYDGRLGLRDTDVLDEGKTYQVKAFLHNDGNTAVRNIRVEFYDGTEGGTRSTVLVREVEANSDYNVSFNWRVPRIDWNEKEKAFNLFIRMVNPSVGDYEVMTEDLCNANDECQTISDFDIRNNEYALRVRVADAPPDVLITSMLLIAGFIGLGGIVGIMTGNIAPQAVRKDQRMNFFPYLTLLIAFVLGVLFNLMPSGSLTVLPQYDMDLVELMLSAGLIVGLPLIIVMVGFHTRSYSKVALASIPCMPIIFAVLLIGGTDAGEFSGVYYEFLFSSISFIPGMPLPAVAYSLLYFVIGALMVFGLKRYWINTAKQMYRLSATVSDLRNLEDIE